MTCVEFFGTAEACENGPLLAFVEAARQLGAYWLILNEQPPVPTA